MKKKLKIARVATVPFFLDHQLGQQMEDLVKNGFEVTAIASPGSGWERMESTDKLDCIPLAIARNPSPFKDLVSLFKLYRLFKSQKFDIVHSTTPKAGLLCALAARLAKVPVRLHTFTGQTWVTKKGIARFVLRFFDKFIVWLNTQCYADSLSQRDFINSEGIGDHRTIKVLGNGSLSGVDLKRFSRENWLNKRSTIHQELEVNNNDFIIIFVGRLSREKGIFELMEAFETLQKKYNELHLFLVGPCEEKQVEAKLEQWRFLPGVHCVGNTNVPERYLSVSDILCLPSYREGFGTVVIEAAAMGLATVGSKINGLSDAVEDGVTGILTEVMNANSLQDALEKLIQDKTLCKRLGEQAFERCQRDFDSVYMSQLLIKEYSDFEING